MGFELGSVRLAPATKVVVKLACLFISRIMDELLNRFSQNLVQRWHMDHGKPISCNPDHATLGLGFRVRVRAMVTILYYTEPRVNVGGLAILRYTLATFY